MSLRRAPGAVNKSLQIYLYRNQLQLTTPDAFYSDGWRYRPAKDAINYLGPFLPSVHTVLALGAGLGSIVQVIGHKGYYPACTLVENDKVVLEWALEFLGDKAKIEPVCMDAQVFMSRNARKYDLIFIDVFTGRVTPDFVTGPAFLGQCCGSLSPGGRVVLNYIINNEQQWNEVNHTFSSIFPNSHVLKIDVNRILISE